MGGPGWGVGGRWGVTPQKGSQAQSVPASQARTREWCWTDCGPGLYSTSPIQHQSHSGQVPCSTSPILDRPHTGPAAYWTSPI